MRFAFGAHRSETHFCTPTRAGRKVAPPALARWWSGCAIAVLVLLSGCTRTFWRTQADADVYQAIGERITDPRWAAPRLDITPDPRSRFFDPYDPDHSPLPPDDPAAHALMHCVDGHRSYQRWHKWGDQLNVENPAWLAQFGITPEQIDPETGAYIGVIPALEKTTLPEAVELSLIHSREYQFQLENVYLAALDVTFERFQFGIRYLGIGRNEPSIGSTYALRPQGRADQLGLNGRFGISQLLPAGGQVAVELANNTIWLFSPNSTSSASALSYSLVQPLLLGAGRKFVLENLTQSERRLLYTLRTLGRFRQTFFTDVVGGGSGFLGLLQQIQLIRNAEDNIRRIERQVAELQALSTPTQPIVRSPLEVFPADTPLPDLLQGQLTFNPLDGELVWIGVMTEEQEEALRALSVPALVKSAINDLIEQIRVVPATNDVLSLQSRLLSSRNQLRSQLAAFQDTLDNFKRLLGLPTDMPIGIDDQLLQQFQLIDGRMRTMEYQVEQFVNEWGRLDEEDPFYPVLQSTTEKYLQLAESIARDSLALVQSDADRVAGGLQERLAKLTTDAERERAREEYAGDVRRFDSLRSRAVTNVENARALAANTRQMDEPDLEKRKELRARIKVLQEELLQIVRGLQVAQIGFRLEMIQIQPFDRSIEEVVALAIENRIDLMNDRAAVMDARRRVEITANRLLSAIDLVAAGDIRNTGSENPLDFRLDRSEFRVGLQFTAPLDQISERNAYRAALIAYQRARRDYIAAEDAVKFQVRTAWRSLDVLKQNLATSRLAVRIAALQFDSAVLDATDPAAAQNRGNGLQGQVLLNALQSVLDAQNQLLSNWINYERSRLNIHRDMGIMEIGPDGLWIDPFYQELSNAAQDLAPTPPPAIWQNTGSDGAGRAGLHGDSGGGGKVVLVGYDPELDGGIGGRARVVAPATGDGRQGSVPGQPAGAGARRQP